jgi:hypothetical protein
LQLLGKPGETANFGPSAAPKSPEGVHGSAIALLIFASGFLPSLIHLHLRDERRQMNLFNAGDIER